MYNKVYLECSDCPIKKNICFCLSGNVSISSARINGSDRMDILEIGGEIVMGIGILVGSESAENIGIVVKLVGKLIENTAYTFKYRRLPVYGLIYTVQNEQIMLAEPGVEPIQMKRSEFLDAKHIRLVFFVCHKTSDMISDLCSKFL